MTNPIVIEDFFQLAKDILNNEQVLSMKRYTQHGNTDCLSHSINVALTCYQWQRKYRLDVDLESCVKGALLHDFCLYDWHVKGSHQGLHGFTHPKKALENARKHFAINEVEADIIVKHMFPLTLKLPKYKESWLISLADKYVAIKEVFGFTNRRALVRRLALLEAVKL